MNYVITGADRLGEGGPKAKFRDNVEAIKTLKSLRARGAEVATVAEQAKLARYVGWGGLPQAFKKDDPDWAKESAELRELLDYREFTQARDEAGEPGEYDAARATTTDAHYTSQEVVQAMYAGLERVGFVGDRARILEPSVGIGNFLGLMPQGLREKAASIAAVEIDPVTSQMAAYLYPQAKHVNQPFQDVNVPQGTFDLVIGNPPFGEQKIDRDGQSLSIHNFFLKKSLDSLREGGLAAFVVSRYFMDAVQNPARELIAQEANLLGAIRLPNTAFAQNALTSVTTDIVFFQKTSRPYPHPMWLYVRTGLDENGQPLNLNQYYVDHPEQMIGRMAVTNAMRKGSADLLPPAGFKGFTEEIGHRLAILPQHLYDPPKAMDLPGPSQGNREANQALCAGLEVDSLFITREGQVGRRLADVLGEPEYETLPSRSSKEFQRVAGMCRLRDCLKQLMWQEQQPGQTEFDLATQRQELNEIYDGFVKEHGFINSVANGRVMKDDPRYPLLAALEEDYNPGVSKDLAKKHGVDPVAPSATKAAIFTKRILGPRPQVTSVGTPKEALLVSMNECGAVNLDFMQSLCHQGEGTMLRELRGLIYLDPATRKWETADRYLTGPVKQKLRQAQEAAESDPRYLENVSALAAVQPPDIDPVDIAVQLGSTWVPPEDVRDFCQELLGWRAVSNLDYNPVVGWMANFNKAAMNPVKATATWGTRRYPAHRLIPAILNHRDIKVFDETGETDEHGKPIKKLNVEETDAAQNKADEIKRAFADWVWKDRERRQRLARVYNDRFNDCVARKYDGSHLTLPGLAENIHLRRHQKDAVWRAVQDGTALFDHVVGAGKSMAAICALMESKRMGLIKKPMVVVPNNIVEQWRNEFMKCYPQARVLVVDKRELQERNRKKFFAKVAMGDYDAVVVAHSSFKKIGMPPAQLNKILNEQIDDLTNAVEQMRHDSGKSYAVKEMEKFKKKLQEKLKARARADKKDAGLTFADLGVDALVVDESQAFKNLFFLTKMSNVAGLGSPKGSDRAFDLFVKCRYLQEKNQGKGVFFLTGTPISNSIVEMFTVQRYLQYDALKEKGLHHLDGWASTFGQVACEMELDAAGRPKFKNRFSKFQNLPELVSMYRTVGDVVTTADIVRDNDGVSFTPKAETAMVIAKRSEAQTRYIGVERQVVNAAGVPQFYKDDDGEMVPVMEYNEGSLVYRLDHMPQDKRLDNALVVTGDGRKSALDHRLIDLGAPDFPGSKVNLAVGNIFQTWQEWGEKKGTQLVFCDLGTPKGGDSPQPVPDESRANDYGDPDDEPEEKIQTVEEMLAERSPGTGFCVYDDLKAKLVARGIPPEQIRFVHEAKTDLQKEKLFSDMNKGLVRVLIGSTEKLGAGVNVQKRLVALHHLDAPWRSSDVEQRNGRIIRQGNLFHAMDPKFQAKLYYYATERTYDTRMWQILETKAESFEQFRRGDQATRSIGDLDEGMAATAGEMKAAASGNELLFVQVRVKKELDRLESLKRLHDRSHHALEDRAAALSESPAKCQAEVEAWEAEAKLRDGHTGELPVFLAEGREYTLKDGDSKDKAFKAKVAQDKEGFQRLLSQKVLQAHGAFKVRDNRPVVVGQYRGFTVTVDELATGEVQVALQGAARAYRPNNLRYGYQDRISGDRLVQRVDNYLAKLESFAEEARTQAARDAEELVAVREELKKPFPHAVQLEKLTQDKAQVAAELRKSLRDKTYKSQWKPQGLDLGANPKTMRQAPKVTAKPAPSPALSR